MKKIINYIFLSAVLAAVSVIAFSCSCNCGVNHEVTIPETVMKNAEKFISQKTTKDFFEKYVSIDLSKSQKYQLGYYLAYKIRIPEKPFVDGLILIYADSLGNITPERGVVGIPNCSSNPAECAFEIDEKKATQIATDAGLEPGIKEWKKMFVWSDKYQAYTWVILSTFEETQGTNGFRGNGREIVINAATGSVIDNKEWYIR